MDAHNQRSANPSDGVVVVGGGLAGLAAAASVARSGHPVTVFEGRGRLGGRATTDERNGFRFNQGPHALYRGGHAESVLTELGVRWTGGRPSLKSKIWFDGRGHLAPADTTSLVRTSALGWRDKAALGVLFARLPKIDPASLAGITVAEWVDGIATTDRLRQLLEAIIRLATYAHEPGVLSADVAVLQLQLGLEGGVTYLDGGWQTLADQLRAVPGVAIESDSTVTELPDARAVIVATGGPAAAGALLGREFRVGPAARAACLDLGLSAPPQHDFLLGGDTPMYCSNHSSVAALAPEGHHHVAAAQYLGEHDRPDRSALREFTLASGIDEVSIVEERYLHAMTTITAIPAAELGGLGGRPRIDDTGHPNVFVAGDWVGADGHLADAALASGRAAALAAVDCLERATWVA